MEPSDKPGSQSSEFWLTFTLLILCSCCLHWFFRDPQLDPPPLYARALVCMVLTCALGCCVNSYIHGRSAIKRGPEAVEINYEAPPRKGNGPDDEDPAEPARSIGFGSYVAAETECDCDGEEVRR